MSRILIVVYALALILLFQYGFIQWGKSGHSLNDAWLILRQDWLVLITLIDATQFALIVLGWMVLDLKKQTLSLWEKLSWFGLTLWLGVPGFLLYAVLRRRPRLI
jgi:hypothetical protein